MKIEFHPEAYEEMLESARFYEDRSEGLGLDFLAAVEETTLRIQEFPHAGAIEIGGLRKRLVSDSVPIAQRSDLYCGGHASTPKA